MDLNDKKKEPQDEQVNGMKDQAFKAGDEEIDISENPLPTSAPTEISSIVGPAIDLKNTKKKELPKEVKELIVKAEEKATAKAEKEVTTVRAETGRENDNEVDVDFSVQPLPASTPNPESVPGAFAQGGRPTFAPPFRQPAQPAAGTTVITEDDTASDSTTSSGLVEARPVQGDIETASPVLNPTKGVEQQKSKCNKDLVIPLLVVAVLVGAAVLGAVLSTSGSDDKPAEETASYGTTTSVLSKKEYLSSLLPPVTLEAMNEASSSQSRAYQWVLDDPHLDQYTPERIQQRFALATLYYATDGPSWTGQDGWLSHGEDGLHECGWFHTPECFHWCDCEDEEVFRPCGDTNTTYKEISLVANGLKGTLPPELFMIPSLESITIKGNSFLTGSLPTELMNHSQALWNLHLSGNALTGTVPTQVLEMPDLSHLRLCCNDFKGTIPTQLGLFTSQMLELVLDTNLLEGTIPTELALLSQMTDMRLHLNDLTGSLPTELGLLAGLEHVQLRDTRISGSLPTEFGLLSNLDYIRMDGCPFVTGSIPTEVGLWKNLTRLHMGKNPNLTGGVPSELGLLTLLKSMTLQNNSLTGTIPTELGWLNRIQWLHLESNEITGTVPTELGVMGKNNLTQLKLFGNELTGPIPSELGLFQMVQSFEVQGNFLTGGIPDDIGLMAKESIVTFNVSDNQLFGRVPDAICDINFTSFDCGALCGCDCPCSN